jgi:hypothetical protein
MEAIKIFWNESWGVGKSRELGATNIWRKAKELVKEIECLEWQGKILGRGILDTQEQQCELQAGL